MQRYPITIKNPVLNGHDIARDLYGVTQPPTQTDIPISISTSRSTEGIIPPVYVFDVHCPVGDVDASRRTKNCCGRRSSV